MNVARTFRRLLPYVTPFGTKVHGQHLIFVLFFSTTAVAQLISLSDSANENCLNLIFIYFFQIVNAGKFENSKKLKSRIPAEKMLRIPSEDGGRVVIAPGHEKNSRKTKKKSKKGKMSCFDLTGTTLVAIARLLAFVFQGLSVR